MFVLFNIGPQRVAEAKGILVGLGLESKAKLVTDGALAGSASVTLDREDPRWPALAQKLRSAGLDSFVRVDRHWSRSDIAEAPLVRLRLATVGLRGGADLPTQAYDRIAACHLCGAGAAPIAPLIVELSRMGRKLIDRTAHDGQVVVHRVLSDALQSEGLTGFEMRPVAPMGRPQVPSEDYLWMRITSELPAMVGANLVTENLCPVCGRSGHFDSTQDPVQFRYTPNPVSADINCTFEYFGVWQLTPSPVGGYREVVVSQRVREVFERLRVRLVSWEPVVTTMAPTGA